MPDLPDDLDDAIAFVEQLAVDLRRRIAECEEKQAAGRAAAEQVRIAIAARDHFNHCAAIVAERIRKALDGL